EFSTWAECQRPRLIDCNLSQKPAPTGPEANLVCAAIADCNPMPPCGHRNRVDERFRAAGTAPDRGPIRMTGISAKQPRGGGSWRDEIPLASAAAVRQSRGWKIRQDLRRIDGTGRDQPQADAVCTVEAFQIRVGRIGRVPADVEV